MTTGERRRWTRDELLLALHLYWRIPFGQQHSRNPQVIELATALGRTPSSVAMKLNNLTSLDPQEIARGVKGLEGASALDREVWNEFTNQHELLAPRSEELWKSRVEGASPVTAPTRVTARASATETDAMRRVRLGQDFFRRVVLANFGGRCALTGIAHPALVNASHVVGWADAEAHRLDPSNGIALNRLHDGAFDRWLITFDEKGRLVVGRGVRESFSKGDARKFFVREGHPLDPPLRHALSEALLARHREQFARVNA